ncbi:carboxyl transferase domain-containing protein [Corynebacterium sp. sy039]|uniref:carboxyl transferase domain-containing protein n=1 Tax=Corynebacterium sp. sy039 TaxID=2599641 RepID=UPI0011B5E1AD|nr:carboxyl transferase domain-containing protein [Corynebacterium sp. sy039]QDZ42192.1 acetyl-CoA carboxylase carboxyl transferase subunit alpha/beta [Corynebacterium sp. sy039]
MNHTRAQDLINDVLDPNSFISWSTPVRHGRISESYARSLEKAQEKTGYDEAVITGEGTVFGQRVALVLSEFDFLGGSVGAATAQRIIDAIHRATAEKLPLLISPSSGGTRMQEGTPAFVLMVSITAAIYKHKDAHLPYLVYLRHPTTGGVMASWGAAGHFTFAQPGALLGFLGPRAVEAVTGKSLPEGVQTAENLANKGIIDGVISPSELRFSIKKIATIVLGSQENTTTHSSAPHHYTPMQSTPPKDAWAAISATRRIDRPGISQILAALGDDNIIALSGTESGLTSPAIRVLLSRIDDQCVVIIAQDRHAQPPHAHTELDSAALQCARRGIALAKQLNLPIITVVDTPGAELSASAEESGIARCIAATLGDLVSADVPTISLILGQGCGGGALALLPADRTLSMSNGWLSPLPPEGASAIVYRDSTHAPEMMDEQHVVAQALYKHGIVDEIIPEPDCEHYGSDEIHTFAQMVLQHLRDCLQMLKENPQRVGRSARFARYEKLVEDILATR